MSRIEHAWRGTGQSLGARAQRSLNRRVCRGASERAPTPGRGRGGDRQTDEPTTCRRSSKSRSWGKCSRMSWRNTSTATCPNQGVGFKRWDQRPVLRPSYLHFRAVGDGLRCRLLDDDLGEGSQIPVDLLAPLVEVGARQRLQHGNGSPAAHRQVGDGVAERERCMGARLRAARDATIRRACARSRGWVDPIG